MNSGEAILRAYERLVEGLADDILAMAEAEILESHRPGAARAAAVDLRRRIHRVAGGLAEQTMLDVPPYRPKVTSGPPEKKP